MQSFPLLFLLSAVASASTTLLRGLSKPQVRNALIEKTAATSKQPNLPETFFSGRSSFGSTGTKTKWLRPNRPNSLKPHDVAQPVRSFSSGDTTTSRVLRLNKPNSLKWYDVVAPSRALSSDHRSSNSNSDSKTKTTSGDKEAETLFWAKFGLGGWLATVSALGVYTMFFSGLASPPENSKLQKRAASDTIRILTPREHAVQHLLFQEDSTNLIKKLRTSFEIYKRFRFLVGGSLISDRSSPEKSKTLKNI